MHTIRRMVALAATVVVGVIGLVVAPTQASAESNEFCGTSHSPGGVTCLTIYGDSLWVTSTRTIHAHVAQPWENYCGYKARNTGYLPNGKYWLKESPIKSGCVRVEAWIDMAIEKQFRHGTPYCGQFYHDGAWAAGKACATIKL